MEHYLRLDFINVLKWWNMFRSLWTIELVKLEYGLCFVEGLELKDLNSNILEMDTRTENLKWIVYEYDLIKYMNCY